MKRSILAGIVVLAGLAGLVVLTLAPAGEADKDVCTAEISPGESVQELVDSLAPGDVGCLEEGTYVGDVTFEHGGTPGDYVTLRSAPNDHATIEGRVDITDQAEFVAIVGLDLNGFDLVWVEASLTI